MDCPYPMEQVRHAGVIFVPWSVSATGDLVLINNFQNGILFQDRQIMGKGRILFCFIMGNPISLLFKTFQNVFLINTMGFSINESIFSRK